MGITIGDNGAGNANVNINMVNAYNLTTHQGTASVSTTATLPVSDAASLLFGWSVGQTNGQTPTGSLTLGGIAYLDSNYTTNYQISDSIDSSGNDIFQGIGSLVIKLGKSFTVSPKISGTFNIGTDTYSVNPSVSAMLKILDDFAVSLNLGTTCDRGPAQKDDDWSVSVGASARTTITLGDVKLQIVPSVTVTQSTNEKKTNTTAGIQAQIAF